MTMAPGTELLLGARDRLLQQFRAEARHTRAMDLRVLSHTVPAEQGMPVGTVTGVTPTGRLSPGETVTLEVAGAGQDGKPGKKPGGPNPPGHNKKDERKQGKP
jgi:hypothetical protein